MTIARSSITGRIVAWAYAKLNPDTTPRFSRKELVYIYSMLDAMTGSTRNVELRTKLLAKIDRMLG